MLLPVIMAGGTGGRLWPMSRELYPKQFLRLFGQNSMLQETITRLGLEIHEPMVICNEEHQASLVAEQLRQLNKAVKQHYSPSRSGATPPRPSPWRPSPGHRHGDDPLCWSSPPDHIINNQSAFRRHPRRRATYADEAIWSCLRYRAERPETSYGYIQRGVAGSPTAPRPVPGGPFRGAETGRERAEAYLCLRGVLLEQRHVYVPCQNNTSWTPSDITKPARLRSMPPITAATSSASRMHFSA